jgi:hypothetical protein
MLEKVMIRNIKFINFYINKITNGYMRFYYFFSLLAFVYTFDILTEYEPKRVEVGNAGG